MVHYRSFYPCDVDGTVAYVTSRCQSEADGRFPLFLAQVGGQRWATCRAQLESLERQLLQRRDALPALVGNSTEALYGLVGGFDRALELGAVSLSWGFWQYVDATDPLQGCASLPTGTLTDAELATWAEALVAGYADDQLRPYVPYYFQAARELGEGASYTAPFAGLLRYPPEGPRGLVDRDVVVAAFDGLPVERVQSWLSTQGSGIVFVSGELDPWSAAPFELGLSTDTLESVAPLKNHYAIISELPSTDRLRARAMVERWIGLSAKPGSFLRPPSRRPALDWRSMPRVPRAPALRGPG
jgi:hypothetical protein